MGERGSGAAGGELPLEERQDRVRARRARMRRMPAPARAEQAQEGTSPLGINPHPKDYGRMDQGPQGWRRRTWLAGASTRRVMIRRDRQWARTRMRPYTAQFKSCRLAEGIQTLQR